MNPPDPVTQSFHTSSSLLTKDEIFFTTFDPKISNRFFCSITDSDNKQLIPSWIIKRVTRPRVSRILGGQWEWTPIEIETYDPIVPSSAQIFVEYIRNPKVFSMEIKVLGPVGDIVELWKFEGAEIVEVDFGPLDWSGYPPESKSKIDQINVVRYYKGGYAITVRATIAYKNAELIY